MGRVLSSAPMVDKSGHPSPTCHGAPGKRVGLNFQLFARALLAVTFLAVNIGAAADDPGMPTAPDFFRGPDLKSVRLSPDGKYVSAITRQNGLGGADNLIIKPTDGSEPARQLTTYSSRQDVDYHLWATPRTILFQRVSGRDEPRGLQSSSGLFAVDRASSAIRRISVPSAFRLAQAPARRSGDVLLWLYSRGRPFPAAGWLNVEQGQVVRAMRSEPGIIAWYADPQQRIRASLLAGEEAGPGRLTLRYRHTLDDPWHTAIPLELGSSDFQGFDEGGRGLWVLTPNDDRVALFRADMESGQLGAPVVADPIYDIDGALLQDAEGHALEISYMADLPRRVVLDPAWRIHYANIDGLLPATFNGIIGWDEGKTRLLVHAGSDRNPGVFYLYYPQRQRLDFLGAVAPWLHREQLSATEPISFPARDGVRLYGYYTPPSGHTGGPAALILNPHGGPYGVRNVWGFDPQTQFLASRGYGVLQVNYRGSGGYGKKFEKAGYGQWGLAMQDDLSDAVAWAVDSGRTDPARVCIFGASYGGYAALMGLIKTPELYRCGISFAGISDRKLMFVNDRLRFSGENQASFIDMFGDPEADPALFEATSPIRNIDRIQAPVLVAHGHVDGAVDIRHYRLLTRQLSKHGKKHERFERRFEGHGLIKESNRIAFYETLAVFLSRHNPTRRNPPPAD